MTYHWHQHFFALSALTLGAIFFILYPQKHSRFFLNRTLVAKLRKLELQMFCLLCTQLQNEIKRNAGDKSGLDSHFEKKNELNFVFGCEPRGWRFMRIINPPKVHSHS